MTLINVNVSSMVVPHMDEYTSGASNSFYVKFTFSPEWDDLTKLVSFKAGSTIASQIMSGDTIAIPHEVLKPCTSLYIGVLGTQGETVVLPTIWKELRKVKYGVEEGTFPVDPTPSQYQQILDIAQSVRDDANAGRFDGEDGISVSNVYIRDSHLICVLSDGTELDAGELPGGGTSDHRDLEHRDAADSHPMSAITGLASALTSKQDTISDLSNIRTGAEKGAAALQPSALNPYRTAAEQNAIDGKQSTAISAIEGKIPSSASVQNQLVTENRMSEAVSAVEAKHLYKTATQGSFATKAELLAAQTFYNADGTIATPTKNDVAYVLADESHDGKLAKYVIAATDPAIVWGFVIAISGTDFTQEQLDALNSGITAAKCGAYDTHVANSDIHVTASDKTSWNGKYNKPSSGIPASDIASGVIPTALSQLSGDSTHRTVTDSEKSTWNAKGTYSKPSSGIPASDLTSAVQESLGRADSALQSVPSTYRTASAQDVIDAGKIDKSAQATKTSEQTEAVGIDTNGKLWSKPGGGGTSDHRQLTNRDADDSHPVSAITGLSSKISDYDSHIADASIHVTSIATIISSVSTDLEIPSAKAVNTFVESKTSNLSDTLTSRGEQLVVNGSAIMKNNTNFSQLSFDGTEANGSNGSFTSHALNLNVSSDYIFPLDPTQIYKISLDAKSHDHTATMYSMIKFLDADGYDIQASNHMYVAGSLTTLTQDLKYGDTVIHFDDLSGWQITGQDRNRIIFWDYVNKLGYHYPAETYSRHAYAGMFDVSGIDIANNTITLSNPWPVAGKFVAGTKVSQGNTGRTFKYQGLSSTKPPTEWTHYTGKYKGTDYSGTNVDNMLPPGTAYGKIGFIWNNNSSTTDQVWVTNISVSAKQENLIPIPTSTDEGKVLKVVNGIPTWVSP